MYGIYFNKKVKNIVKSICLKYPQHSERIEDERVISILNFGFFKLEGKSL